METGPTDCEYMYRAILHPNVMQKFLKNPDGMIELVKSFARDELDVYDEIDISKNPELRQDGKVVVVTGAGRGIGQAIALMFAKANARAVCICSRTAVELQETRQMIREANDETEVYAAVANVATEREVEAFFSAVKDKFGSVDRVVSNAGSLSPSESISEGDTISWWNNFEVNLEGAYLVSKHFARKLGGDTGTLINISSCVALAAVPNESDYAISKLAAMRLMETLHIGYPNIRGFSIHPGAVETAMSRELQTLVKDDLRWNWTSPNLAAAVCLWVTTEKAEFLRGRWFSANWRVDDLKAQQEQILSKNLLKTSFNMKIGP